MSRHGQSRWPRAGARPTLGWLETPELEGLAAAEQAARFILDAWEGPIREWLSSRVDVAIPEVLEHALAFPHQDWTESAQKGVGKILTRWASLKGGQRAKNVSFPYSGAAPR
jgi:hypothetical protein